MEFTETMIHLMPSYSAIGRGETISSYYPTSASLYGRDNVSLHTAESHPTATLHSSFLIDDILGKREREAGHNRIEHERDDERRNERDREGAIERDSDSRIHTDNDIAAQNDVGVRDVELHRLREIVNDSNRFRALERERQLDRERELPHDRHSQLLQVSKSIPSPPAPASSLLSADISRPMPINPAAIHTSALTTPTIYKPLPTLYDPSILQQTYMNPHFSACQSTLMRQMCGNMALGSIPGYTRQDYPAMFDSQCNAFSKGKKWNEYILLVDGCVCVCASLRAWNFIL